jgi:hypothetical protein
LDKGEKLFGVKTVVPFAGRMDAGEETLSENRLYPDLCIQNLVPIELAGDLGEKKGEGCCLLGNWNVPLIR